MEKIKIINKSKYILPEYQTEGSAGVAIRAELKEPILLYSLERAIVPTGLFIELPKGYEAQLRPRSGLAAKQGVTLLNCIGTIDSDYRGEIKVILVNLSNDAVEIQDGDRIAQMVFAKYKKVKFIEVESLEETDRGAGGFGSTGIK